MKRPSFDGLAWLGWAVFLTCFGIWLSGFQSRWTIGRYGMPRVLTGPDGLTYPDGTPLDPPSLFLSRSGCEEEILLTLVVLLGLGILVVIREMIACARLRRQLRRSLEAEADRSQSPRKPT